jgi:hypothetical protein
MNTLARVGQVNNLLKEEYDKLVQLGYGDLNFDALWKWSAILTARATLPRLPGGKSIDIGGGYSPVHHLCSLEEQVINVDRNFNDGWFESKDQKYVKAQNTPSCPANIQYIEEPFEQYAAKLPNSCIDRCYDGCSIIHFQKTNNVGRYNDGCAVCADHISRLLKPGGYFIMSADTCAPRIKSKNPEWLTAEQLRDCFMGSGLVPVGLLDFVPEDLYTYPANDGTLLTLSLHTFQKPA